MSIGDVYVYGTRGKPKNEDWDDDDWSTLPGAIRRGMILEPGLADYVEQQRRIELEDVEGVVYHRLQLRAGEMSSETSGGGKAENSIFRIAFA